MKLRGNRLVRNILSNYVGFGVSCLLVLFLTPYLSKRLGPSGFGAWVLLQTVHAYFQLLEFGIPTGLIRFVSHHRAKGERATLQAVWGRALRTLIVPSLAVLPLAWVVSRHGPGWFGIEPGSVDSFRWGILVLGPAAVVTYFKRALYAVLEGYQRFDLLNLASVTGLLLGAGLTVAAVEAGYGLEGLVAVLLVQGVYEACVVAAVIHCQFRLRPTMQKPGDGESHELLRFSFWALVINVAVSVAERIDALVIGFFMPMVAVAHYAIGFRMANVLEKVTFPLIDTFFPLASHLESGADRGSLSRLFVEGTRLTVSLTVPGLIVVGWYARDLILIWMQDESYVEPALPVLLIFLFRAGLEVFNSTSSSVRLGCGKIRFEALASLAIAVANVAISLALVRPMGLVGVALGTLIPTAIASLFVTVPYTCRLTGTPIHRLYLDTFGVAALFAAFAVLVCVGIERIVEPPLWAFLLSGAIACGIGGAVSLLALRSRAIGWTKAAGLDSV